MILKKKAAYAFTAGHGTSPEFSVMMEEACCFPGCIGMSMSSMFRCFTAVIKVFTMFGSGKCCPPIFISQEAGLFVAQARLQDQTHDHHPRRTKISGGRNSIKIKIVCIRVIEGVFYGVGKHFRHQPGRCLRMQRVISMVRNCRVEALKLAETRCACEWKLSYSASCVALEFSNFMASCRLATRMTLPKPTRRERLQLQAAGKATQAPHWPGQGLGVKSATTFPWMPQRDLFQINVGWLSSVGSGIHQGAFNSL